MVDNGYLLGFRWLEQLVGLWKVFGLIKLAVPNNRHQPRQIWPRSWPDKRNSSTSLCRLKWASSITSPEAEMNLHRPVIKTSLVLSLHYFIRRMSPLTLTLGSAPSSPNSPYCLSHVQMRTRHSSQPNNSVALPHLVGSLSCHAACQSCCHLGRVLDHFTSAPHPRRTH
jgi:hypothetical protein